MTLDDHVDATIGDLDDFRALTVANEHPTPRDPSIIWACAGADPELFFPTTRERYEEALTYCCRCAAAPICGELGVNRREYGIWGGQLLGDGVPVEL